MLDMAKRRLAQLSDSEEEEKAGKEWEKSEGGSDEDQAVEVKPVGEPLRRIGRGRAEKRYYQAFELEGSRFELEDPVLVTPEEKNQKPYVAIIKEIKQNKDGSLLVVGQWFYRPEETEKKGGGNWNVLAYDARELFYSFHRDEVAAESVMHKCVVHFIPPHKQAPSRSKHPGFIVRRVYDTVEKKLWRLTDKDYEDSKQKEIDLLMQKTQEVLGELPDMELEEAIGDQEDAEKTKRQIRRKIVPPLSCIKEDPLSNESLAKEGFSRPETPGSCLATEIQGGNEFYKILQRYNALTGTRARDRWLEKIIQGVKNVFNIPRHTEDTTKLSEDNVESENRVLTSEDSVKRRSDGSSSETKTVKNLKGNDDLLWPEAAVMSVTALERTVFDSLGADIHKYNLKMRQLEFNLKNNSFLACRLLKRELDPSTVYVMTPAELKDGVTAEEKSAQEPEEPGTMQMADVRCTICGEKQVGVKDIIHVGYGDRYQLECLKCGNSWYASRDAISSLTIETAKAKLTVGTAPWATSKFEDVEREFMSPREQQPHDNSHEAAAMEANQSSEQQGRSSQPITEPASAETEK